jgi:hypothetical protein
MTEKKLLISVEIPVSSDEDAARIKAALRILIAELGLAEVQIHVYDRVR